MARKSRRTLIGNTVQKEASIKDSVFIVPQLATAAYIRLSVEKEGDESIQTQMELVHQYIASHEEYQLVDTYVDNGYTGTDFDRPGFMQLMDDVRTGKIQCIVVKDLSRFGRNAIETGYYIETIFPCLNVRLIAINDDFDSSREEDRNSMIVPIKNMINEMYAKDASKKRVLAFEMQSRQGNVKIGRSIYGYSVDKENNQLVINPETAPVVRMIFRWYLMGVKTGDIAKRLEMLGVTTPNSYKAVHEAETKIPETDHWTGNRIATILTNEAYVGITVHGKRKRAKYKNIPEHHTDPEEWIIHEHTHEAIIAEPDFDEVQLRWNENSQRCKERAGKGRDYGLDLQDSFPSKIKCMECGNTMVYKRYTNHGQAHGIRKGFYYCAETEGKMEYCRQQVNEDLIRITVMDQIHNLIRLMCDRKVLLEKMRDGSCDKGEVISLRVKLQNLKYRLVKVEETSATLYENFSEGLLSEEEFRELKEHYTSERQKIHEEMKHVQARQRIVEKQIQEFLDMEKHLEQYLDDRSFNQELVNELVEQVEVSSKGMIEVKLKCRDVFQEVLEIMEK